MIRYLDSYKAHSTLKNDCRVHFYIYAAKICLCKYIKIYSRHISSAEATNFWWVWVVILCEEYNTSRKMYKLCLFLTTASLYCLLNLMIFLFKNDKKNPLKRRYRITQKFRLIKNVRERSWMSHNVSFCSFLQDRWVEL